MRAKRTARTHLQIAVHIEVSKPCNFFLYQAAASSRSANTAKKVGGGAAAAAIVGAIVGGNKGAAVGAGVGAGAGTAVQVVTRGQRVQVPSETLLEFRLQQPLIVNDAS